MLGRLFRVFVILAVALNVTLAVPTLAFAHAQMTHEATAIQQPAVQGHEHEHGHDHAAMQEHDRADHHFQNQADQSPQAANCHCDMGMCSPMLSSQPRLPDRVWSLTILRTLLAPDDALQLADLLPPLRPPRA